MQTSVKSNTPRIADRNLSTESVHISREVSVVSSRLSAFPAPYVINDYVPASFSPAPASDAGQSSEIDRWNTRRSEVSWKQQRRPSSQLRTSMQDPGLLDSNRESMKALSDFLRTKEPPPNNFISIPSDDERSLRKSAFNLFGKRKKKAKAPKLMQLPESAVSAKTRSGARHIAISIPMEHNQQQNVPRPVSAPLRSNPTSQYMTEKSERGAVTVLKPVAEVRESNSSFLNSPGNRDGMIGGLSPPPTPRYTAMAELPASDSLTRSSSAPRLGSMPFEKQSQPVKLDPQRPQRSYVAVSPASMERHKRQDSGMDPRYSSATTYSTLSMATASFGHTRGVSSVSTAPSASTLSPTRLDPPPRTSSMAKMSKVMQQELANTSELVNERGREERPLSPTTTSGRESTSPPTIFGIAEARGYNISPVGQLGRPQIVRHTTPKPQAGQPPKTVSAGTQIPDAVVVLPPTGLPTKTRNGAAVKSKEAMARRAALNRESTDDAILVTRQSRQEKVKARKLRDIESTRTRSSARRPLSESNGSPNISRDPSVKPVPIPPRSHKRGFSSQDLSKKKLANSISPIMLVASLPPYTGPVTAADLPYRRHSRTRSYNSADSFNCRTRTPPRSIITSLASETEHSTITSPNTKRRSPTQSLRSSILETRRQERRAKRNMTLREQDMDARMLKIEHDNRMLLQTLGGIARSFGEMGRAGRRDRERDSERGLGSKRGMERGFAVEASPAWQPSDAERMRTVDLEKMAPVMRELQDLAPGVEGENHVQLSEDERDEDLEMEETRGPVMF